MKPPIKTNTAPRDDFSTAVNSPPSAKTEKTTKKLNALESLLSVEYEMLPEVVALLGIHGL